MPSYRIVDTGGSRSFPEGEGFLLDQSTSLADVAIVIGQEVGAGLMELDAADYRGVAIELDSECLGVHAPEDFGAEGSKLIGFSRFRLGDAAPTDLIELVRQPGTEDAALEAVRAVFEQAGLVVAVCRDAPGRIVDRLARPYFNRALNALDTGLADAAGLDTALRMGLGYRRGPIDLLRESGLEHHFRISASLYDALGEAPYLPARRAQVAGERTDGRSRKRWP